MIFLSLNVTTPFLESATGLTKVLKFTYNKALEGEYHNFNEASFMPAFIDSVNTIVDDYGQFKDIGKSIGNPDTIKVEIGTISSLDFISQQPVIQITSLD